MSNREPFLPTTDLTIADARMQLSGWHFAKESLTTREWRILHIAEALLGELDRIHGGYARTALTDDEVRLLATTLERSRRATGRRTGGSMR